MADPLTSLSMPDRLEFYPASSVAYLQYWIVAGAGGLALLLVHALIQPGEFTGWALAADIARLIGAAACTITAALAWRRARRIAEASARAEPQLALDRFGLEIRGDLLWRVHRFPWSRVMSIEPLPEEKGLSIVITGDLKPLGRRVEILTDSQEGPEWLAERLARFRGPPTFH